MSTAPAPRAGVVIRTKNRPWFLARALRDVLSQSFTDWRIQIVNDGGDRGEVDRVVASLQKELGSRIGVLHNDAAVGRSGAANLGIRALDCDYVVLHDDDDLWAPDFLLRTVEHLDSHAGDVGVVVRTDIVYEVQRGEAFEETGRAAFWPQLTEISYSDLLQVNRAVPIAFLYRRGVHDLVGPYREDLHAVEDWDLYLRIALHHHIALLDGPPLAFWMQRTATTGEMGNSVFALAGEHERYDRQVRDEALRQWVSQNGAGLPLYLTRFIQEEVARQVAAKSGISSHLVDAVRRWRFRRRTR